MGYHVIDPEQIDPTPDRPSIHRTIGQAAGLENMAVNYYKAAPGEQLPLAYHVHAEQEEVFYVLDGVLHVETPDGEWVAETGEVFIAEPESPHRTYNPESAETPTHVLAIGAPVVDDATAYDPDDGGS